MCSISSGSRKNDSSIDDDQVMRCRMGPFVGQCVGQYAEALMNVCNQTSSGCLTHGTCRIGIPIADGAGAMDAQLTQSALGGRGGAGPLR